MSNTNSLVDKIICIVVLCLFLGTMFVFKADHEVAFLEQNIALILGALVGLMRGEHNASQQVNVKSVESANITTAEVPVAEKKSDSIKGGFSIK